MDINQPETWTDAFGKPHKSPAPRDRISAILSSFDLSHFAARPWCGRDMIHAYRRDEQSPSKCTLWDSFDDCPEVRALLVGIAVQVGGSIERLAALTKEG